MVCPREFYCTSHSILADICLSVVALAGQFDTRGWGGEEEDCAVAVPTLLPTYLHTYLPPYLPIYLPTYLPVYLPTL